MSSTSYNEPSGTTKSSRIEITPRGKALGAGVDGIDLRALHDDQFTAVYRAWLDHQVILFRNQRLTVDELLAFSRGFGELDWAPVQETGRRFVEGYPEVYVVSNVIENGLQIGSLGAGEAAWHTDMSYLEEPPKASILYAVEVPPAGGNTYFCSMYRAYEALPEALRRRIEGLMLKHDGTYNSGGYLRQGTEAINDPVNSQGAYHPIVCTHPETHRRLLYLGRRRNAYVGGLPLSESEELLNELWSYATLPESVWQHEWRVGDLVLWDNRCTMHRRDAFDATTRRVMQRTQIKGETRPGA